MYKPIIGVLPQYDYTKHHIKVEEAFFLAIKQAGGVPVMLPLHNDAEDLDGLLSKIDGFLFTGGPDISPLYWGEEPIPEYGSIMPDRDRIELALLPILAKMNKPVLGICRGLQAMNVALGGTLIQDIPLELNSTIRIAHSQKSAYEVLTHTVSLHEDTLLYRILGKPEILVNSLHHQAVGRIAPKMRASAFAKDGVIEAIELKGHRFYLGVQWHPEWICQISKDALRLFEALVEASSV